MSARVIVVRATVSLLAALPVSAQTPQGTAFTYQGRLGDGGTPAQGAFDFQVQSDLPRTRVSRQVTGIRRDPYAERHRIPVEEAKPDEERGTCLHAEEWGAPAARGLDARRRLASLEERP